MKFICKGKYDSVTLRKDSMDLEAKELLRNKVLGSAEEHQEHQDELLTHRVNGFYPDFLYTYYSFPAPA